MGKKWLALLVASALLLGLSGLAAAAQGRGGGPPFGTPPGQEKRITGEEAGEMKLEGNGRQIDKEKAMGPPAFVQEMLQRRITVMEREKLKIRSRPFESDLPPVIMGGRILVPVRAVANSLGAHVEWDPQERKITIAKGGIVIELYLGELIYYVNGEARELDVEAQILNNRTFVPLRFIAVALGEKVGYNPDTGKVTIGDDENNEDAENEDIEDEVIEVIKDDE